MTKGKKLLAMLLCLSMCLSLLPAWAMAEEAPEDSEEVYADLPWTEESFEEEPESILAFPEEEHEPEAESPDPAEYEPELPETEMPPEAEETSPETDAPGADPAEESENGTEAPAEEPGEELPDPADSTEDTDTAADAEEEPTEEPTEEPGEESDADEEEDAPVEATASSGTCGDNLTWRLDSEGLLVISGTGAMTDYNWYSEAPWGTDIKSVRIEQGVTSVGDFAFYFCTSLMSATIPNSVTTIGSDAFDYCRSLTSVTIPDSVTSIGSYAFEDCYSLASVTIGNSVTSIGGSAFSGCSRLTSVTIPDSVTSIGSGAFADCSSLITIQVAEENPVYTSADGILYNKNRTELITVPGGVSGHFNILSGVTSIGHGAFWECKSLTSVTIPDSVTSIRGSAFAYCINLTGVTIPDSVTSIGYSAFYGCSSLTSVTIPANVTSIENSVFWNCSSLTSVAIPDSVTSIGQYAFYGCSSLAEITLPILNTHFGYMFGADSHSDNSSYVPSSLKTVRMTSGESIPANYFSKCGSLTNVTIPSSVTSIGKNAFQNCSSLMTITMEGDMPDVHSSAFPGVTATVFYHAGNETYTPAKKQNYGGKLTWKAYWIIVASGVCGDGLTWTLNDAGLLAISGTGAMTNYSGSSAAPWGTGIKSVRIEQGVMSIGEFAFSGCGSLASVTVPDGVMNIGNSAFQSCGSLRSVTLGNSVASIGNYAFSGCGSLRRVTIPGSVTSVGSFAFQNCGSLTRVTMEGDMPGIGSSAFSGVTATVFYLEGNATYTAGNMLGYGGTLTWEAIPLLVPDWSRLPEELTLDRGYLLLNMSSDEVTLGTNLTDPAFVVRVDWTTESGTADVISVSDGTVTANAPGTDYVVATLSSGEKTLTARCRIDVLDEEQQGKEEILVLLPEKQLSAELFKTDYSRFSVALVLEQNVQAADATRTDETKTLEDAGVTITGAEFVGGGKQDIRDAFRLRVVDDRTLEIIPTIDLDDAAEVKGVAKSYKSSVRLTLSNGQTLTTPELTLKVGKTLPKLKAAAVKLNSFIDGHTAPVIITGGRVKSFTSSADAKASALATIGSDLTVTVIGTEIKGSGKFSLSCELEDWAVHANVTVPVNVTYTAPKATLKPASVSLKAEVDNGAETVLTLVPLPGMSHSVTVEGVSGLSAAYDEVSGKITVRAGSAAPGTYKVPVLADGKQVALLTVKVLPKNSQVSLTAKATGAIDTAVPNSPVVITVGGKNCNPTEDEYTVEILQTNKERGITDQPANSRFNIVKSGNVVTVTGDPETLTDKVEGYTYSARISSEILGAKPATVKLTVKASKKTPAASATLKAAGSIDVLRPGTEVVVTPTFKNWYGYDLSKATLSLDAGLFEYEPVDGKFVIRPVYGADIDPKAGYTVSMTLDGYTTKAVKLPVKMGAVKIGQSVKELTLLKNDRFDRQSVKLILDDDTLYDIDGARVELDAKSADKYSLTKLDSGEYAIGYKDNILPESVTGSSVTAAAVTPDDTVHADAGGGVTDPTGPVDIGGGKPKSDAVKLNVFLTGNGGSKPNKVITVKLKLV